MTDNTDTDAEADEIVVVKRTRKATKAAPTKAARNSTAKEKTKNRLGRVVTEHMVGNYSELANRADKRGDASQAAYWRELCEKVK